MRGRRQTAENAISRIGTPRPPSEPAPADDVVDLGEDLVEETGETEPPTALRAPPSGTPRSPVRGERGERHRRPTPSSSVPATLAASMAHVLDDFRVPLA